MRSNEIKSKKRENKMIVTRKTVIAMDSACSIIESECLFVKKEISYSRKGIKNRQQKEKKNVFGKVSRRFEKCRAANYGRISYWIQNNFNLLPRRPSNASSTIVKLLDTKQYSFAIL